MEGLIDKFIKYLFLTFILLFSVNHILSIEHHLYNNNFQMAESANESLYNRKRISRDEYLINKGLIQLFKGNREEICQILSLYQGDYDITKRNIIALLYFCEKEELFSLIDEHENISEIFPLYRGIFLFQKGMYNEATASFSRMNINRLSKMELQEYNRHNILIMAKAKDINGLVEMIRRTESYDIINSIQDIEILRELTFHDIPYRQNIINDLINYYFDNNFISEGINYIRSLHRRRIITTGSYRAIERSFREKPIGIFMEMDEDIMNSLGNGIRKYTDNHDINISFEKEDSSIIRYEIIDSLYAGEKNRFYIPVISSFRDSKPNVINPIILFRDKIRSLAEDYSQIMEKKTLLVIRERDKINDTAGIFHEPVFKVGEIGYISDSDRKEIEYIILDGTSEEIFIILNDLNLMSFENLRRIFLLNDMTYFAPMLKGNRYRERLFHIPVYDRIIKNSGIKDIQGYDRYYFLGYDTAGIIDLVENRRQIFRGLLADYYIEGGELKKNISYEKLE